MDEIQNEVMLVEFIMVIHMLNVLQVMFASRTNVLHSHPTMPCNDQRRRRREGIMSQVVMHKVCFD